jgi:glycosyltransferase involved in cell wall biosynthesis
MSAPLLSVVVPAYNAAATIGDCIAALRRQTVDGPVELIVVDDGSSDDTAALARAAGAMVLSAPHGHAAAARNVGLRAARGALICFTDADCAPHPDWLSQISRPFADPDVIGCKGTYATRQRQLVARFVQLEYEDKYDRLRPQATIDFIDTYSCAYRRAVLLANGGFDESIRYVEDQELSFRLAARGYKMVFQESAVVDHLHSATLPAYLRKKANIGLWKMRIIRRFPDRAVRDSHTPQVIKVQMALAGLLLVALSVAAVGLIIGWTAAATWLLAGAAAVALVFLATTLPFVRKAWGKDRAVALAAPGLLFSRAVALGWGTLRGILAPSPPVPALPPGPEAR